MPVAYTSAGHVRITSQQEATRDGPAIVLAVHGYGQPLDTFQAFAESVVPPDAVLVMPEGPSTFYRRPGGRGGASKGGIGSGWIADPDRALTDERNDTFLLAALDAVAKRHPPAARRPWLLAYSQGVGVATHVFARHPDRFAGLVGLAGGVPATFRPALRTLRGKPVLWITGNRDTAYPVPYTDAVVAAWREAGVAVETVVLDAGHDLLDAARGLVHTWLREPPTCP